MNKRYQIWSLVSEEKTCIQKGVLCNEKREASRSQSFAIRNYAFGQEHQPNSSPSNETWSSDRRWEETHASILSWTNSALTKMTESISLHFYHFTKSNTCSVWLPAVHGRHHACRQTSHSVSYVYYCKLLQICAWYALPEPQLSEMVKSNDLQEL